MIAASWRVAFAMDLPADEPPSSLSLLFRVYSYVKPDYFAKF